MELNLQIYTKFVYKARTKTENKNENQNKFYDFANQQRCKP